MTHKVAAFVASVFFASSIGAPLAPASALLPPSVGNGQAANRNVQATIGRARPISAGRSALAVMSGALTGSTLIGEGFSAAVTQSNAWLAVGGACLTAGTSGAAATPIPACNGNAPQDAIGQGALQLTSSGQVQSALIVNTTPLSTANGLQVTFTDYAFNGSITGADGMTVFLSDASQAMPTALGQLGGSLGYANSNGQPGIANAYLGIGLDEYGNFSSNSEGRNGGPGPVAETIAVRGAASSGYQYLGGATGANGAAATLPFAWDQPALLTRPVNAPTIRLSLTPSGMLSLAVDRHDGNGFTIYYSAAIVGVGGQPAVPARVYVGLTASTGGSYNQHQIGGFSVTSLNASAQFAPTQINNLASWFDGADATSMTKSAATTISAWNDKSGNGNVLHQTTGAKQPSFTTAGINGLGSVSFNGGAYMLGTDPAFSTKTFNESTTFIVANQANSTQTSSLAWTGALYSSPRWNIRLSEQNQTHFDFNTLASRLGAADSPTGPALWTAAGSVSTRAQFVRKNGNLLVSGSGPAAAVSGNYPLALGAMASGNSAAYFYTGQLGEVLVYKRLLSSAESAQVEGYLACKWSLQSRLPANHPYRYLCPQRAIGVLPPSMSAPSDALPQPTELRSSNGMLTFNVAAQASATTGNPQLMYNGSNVPPTLRLLPGDTLVVNINNALPAAPAGAAFMNDISLHYHGLHVTPNAPGDDSIDMIAAPGQSLHYQFTIPANQPPGLYWYHSHAHGETERQTLAGMSGALIVDGIAQYVPQVANLPERVLIVRDAPIPGQPLAIGNANQMNAMRWSMRHGAAMGPRVMLNHMHVEVRAKTTAAARNPYVLVNTAYRKFIRPLALSTHCSASETAVHALTVNGQIQPAIAIRPGEQQFWRLVNAGADTYLDVQVDRAQMQIVALDGVPLSSTGTTNVLTVNDYIVPPSSRIEFIVTGPAAGTPAFLRTNCFDAGQSGNAMPATVLASINSSASISDQAKLRAATALKQRVGTRRLPALRTVRSIKAMAVAQTQTVYYSDQNTINGVAYDPGAPPLFYAQSGTVQEWTIVNNSTQVHTFHIHQIHFVVEAINGAALAQQFVMDNVNIPAATAAGPGTVKILLDFTDPLDIGTFLLHCHILSHEDGGMMAKIRIGSAPPLGLSAPSASFVSAAAPAQTVTVTGGQAPFSVNGCAYVAAGSVNGNSVTIAPSGAGQCVLTVADSTGLTGSIAVSVQGAAAVVTLTPTTLSFAGNGAASQSVTLSGGTQPYTASGCAGTANTLISGATVAVAPVAVGSCTLTLTDTAANSATVSVAVNAGTAGGNPLDNLTFHHDAMRSGWYSAEQKLTPATVAASNFGLLTTLTAPAGLPPFGKVYAQPLYVRNETVSDGSQHNLVVVATSSDQIYAYDDVTRAVVWHRDFTNPAAGITQQSSLDSGCDDVNPNVGITGTPVIDRTRDVLYVVVPTKENGNFHLRLHAISLRTGFEATDTNGNQVGPSEVTATFALASGGAASVDPEWNFQRSALLESNGNIYIALASHCDFRTSTTHGWMLAYSGSTLQQTGNMLDLTNLNNGSNYFLGSPWMSGFGPSSDAQGNIFFATGNGPFNGTSNFSMSVLELPGTLDITKAKYFTPSHAAVDSIADADLGSGGVMLLPDLPGAHPHVLVAGGKSGAGNSVQGQVGTFGNIKYLLDRDNLGGQTSGDTGPLWKADTGGAMWGGPAAFQTANGTNYIVYGNGYPLNTYALNTAPLGLAVQSSANVGCLECRDQGSQPIVSSNGTQPATAVVWALKTPGQSGGTISLYAFDALNMGHTLFAGAAGGWTIGPNSKYIGGALISPLVANGSVYVPVDGGVAVFGLH